MKKLFPDKFFIAGTDTDVGKTVVSAMLTVGLSGSYWKVIQCGKDPLSDSDQIMKWTECGEERIYKEAYLFSNAISAHAASKAEGIKVDLSSISLPVVKNYPLIVEGGGGLFHPLNEEDFIIDLIKRLNLPVVLVARSQIGTINHTVLSIRALRAYNIEILGVIMNGPSNQINRQAIEHYGKVSVLAELETLETINKETLQMTFNSIFAR